MLAAVHATKAFSGAAVELTVAAGVEVPVVVVPLAVAVVVMLLTVLVDIPLDVEAVLDANLSLLRLAEIADNDIAPLE